MNTINSRRKCKRQRLTSDMLTMHNWEDVKSITVNQYLSAKAVDQGLKFAYYHAVGDKAYITLCKDKSIGCNHMTVTTVGKKKPQCLISHSEIVNKISNWGYVGEGSYRVKVAEVKNDAFQITLLILGITDVTIRKEEKKCTGEEKPAEPKVPTIADATDQELYDELKRRGYEGTLTKINTLG